jgi:threonine synthase
LPHSFFTHLECSRPCDAPILNPRERHHLCRCGAPLLARYDLGAARVWSREVLKDRAPNMWRYRELMPVFDDEVPVTLGEGLTPLLHATTLGARLGLDWLYVKDESLNPTNSFKARGQSAAITRARALGVTTVSVPSAGNAGNAMAAYAARAGLAAKVFLPRDVKTPFVRECVLYGADVTLVDGFITDAARAASEAGASRGWYDVSTLKEPYRIEGKKTMAYELAEQMEWEWPDWIILSDRWRHRDGRHVEGVRRDRAPWLGRSGQAAADGVGAGQGMRTDRARIREWCRVGDPLGESRHGGGRPARATRDR